MRILYIEDSDAMVKSVTRVMRTKYEVLVAENCAGAQAELDRQPDLILMDMGLPDCEGIDLLRVIRDQQPTIPIIATTAFAFEEQRESFLAAGCTEYLRKPYGLVTLMAMLKRYEENLSR